MQPIEFPEQNKVFKAPEGMDNCSDLPVCECIDFNFNTPVIISKWKLTPEELQKVNETGEIWLSVVGQGMPPVCLMVDYPFIFKDQLEDPYNG